MDFNSKNIPLERIFNASKPSSSHLGGAFMMDRENILLNNFGIYGVHNQGNAANKPNIPKGSPTLGVDMPPKKKKISPFRDENLSMAPHKVIGTRGTPPGEINTPVSQKKRRIDAAQSQQAASTVISNGLPPTKQGLRSPELLPIQHESWSYLPEMWEHCGPDGRPVKVIRWSPNLDGDHTTTYKSDRIHQNGDRKNATAATVATWVELNRLRARYQELVAEFHGGSLVVRHLADKESDEKLVAIFQASEGMEKAMARVGRAAPPRPRLSWATAPAPASEPIKRPMATQIRMPVFVSPLDTLLFAIPAEVASARGPTLAPTRTTLPVTLPTSPAPPPSNPRDNPASPPTAAPPIVWEQKAIAPSNLPSSSKPTKRMQKAARTSQSTTPASTSLAALSSVSSIGQFRFTPAGEARFKLLCAQGEYEEMWEMMPAEQHFHHITAPSAIAAFRSEHPRPNKGGKGKQNVETELWVCKAKVKIERRELTKGDVTEELSILYSDEPCNGVAGSSSNMVRHKKRTHLGRPYDSNITEDSGGGKQKK